MDCDAAAASGRIDRRTLLRTAGAAGALASLPTRAQSAK
jgi:hypothetical protein